jgi:hypothetical protein
MAAGNSLCWFDPRSASLPATAFAQHDVIAGASTPAENVPVLAFDSAATEYADFRGRMPRNYAGGGVTCSICSGAGTATGGITWEIAFRRIVDDAEDLDSTAFTYDYNSLDVAAVPSAIGEVTYDDLAFTDGADMDGLLAGEEFILRIRRKHDDTNDTAAADGYLHGIEIREAG